MINLKIDGKLVSVPEGSTILDAAKALNITIPTLCHLNLHDTKMVNKSASCRVCVVEVKGRKNLAPSCSTPVFEGMEVTTNNVRVMESRRMVMELLISDHPKDCLSCRKAGNCELQDLSSLLSLRGKSISGTSMSTYKKDVTPSLIRDMDKCILCRRCETMCNDVQEVGALSGINRGFDAVVSSAFQLPMMETVCTHCGQCVAVCPTGALTENDHSWKVFEALSDPTKTVIVQTAPAVRVALGEAFGEAPGSVMTGKMVAALKQMGFDYVFDTNFSADLTIMEEGAELLDRLDKFLNDGDKSALPILTSCCPAWVNFIESQFPELIHIPSSSKSPQQMFGAIAKSYFAEKIGVNRKDLIVVSLMPCLAKKKEAHDEEFSVDGNPDVDIVITTREFATMIRQMNIDIYGLEDKDFDDPLGISTGAGMIFGSTGGVIEAAVRTAFELKTKKSLEKIEFEQLRGFEGIRVGHVDVDGFILNIGIAHGLGNAKALLEEIRDGNPRDIHAIEVMACPGGCIGGAGQPYHHGDSSILKMRQQAIYNIDKDSKLRKSHENPSIIELYKNFLGEPLGERAHQLLHTHYSIKEKV